MQSLFIKEVRGNERGIRLFFENGVIIFFPSATAGFLLSILRLRNFAETALLPEAFSSANHVYGGVFIRGKGAICILAAAFPPFFARASNLVAPAPLQRDRPVIY